MSRGGTPTEINAWYEKYRLERSLYRGSLLSRLWNGHGIVPRLRVLRAIYNSLVRYGGDTEGFMWGDAARHLFNPPADFRQLPRRS